MADDVVEPSALETPQETPNSFMQTDDPLDASLRDAFVKAGAPIDGKETQSPPKDIPKEVEPPKPNENEDPRNTPKDEPPIEESKDKKDPVKQVKDDGKPLIDPKSVVPPSKLSKASQQGWDTLKASSEKAYARATRLEQENKTLRSALAQKSTETEGKTKTLSAEVEELKKYRALVDMETDPDFVKKYAEPMDEIKLEMSEILKSLNVDELTIKGINFKDSREVSIVAKKIADVAGDSVASQEFLDKAQQLIRLERQRTKELTTSKENYKKYYEEKRNKDVLSSTERETRIQQHIENVSQSRDAEGNFILPFMVRHFPAQDATPGQIEQIEKHNKMVDFMNTEITQILSEKEPEKLAENAVRAVYARYLHAVLQNERAEKARIEGELARISKSSTEKGTSPNVTGTYKKPDSLELEDAMSHAFPNMR